jgi:hypothetical protein
LAAWPSGKLIPLQYRQVGNRRPSISRHLVRHVGMNGIVVDGADPGLRHDFARLILLRHAVLQIELSSNDQTGSEQTLFRALLPAVFGDSR